MRTPYAGTFEPDQRGVTLIELMMALVVLALGVLAVSQLFPAGAQTQLKDRLLSSGNYYAQEKIEDLETKTWADAELAIGRHPAVGYDSLGTQKKWLRYHEVVALAAPLDNLRKVRVSVSWTYLGNTRQVAATTYVRR